MSNALTQTSITELPAWAQPYAKETLGKAQALTDINQNPYQQYTGERIAQFSPLQETAFQTVGAMQPAQQLGTATGAAQLATLGGLNASYDPYQMGQFTSQAAGQYMNPFVEMAMAPQLREAQRSSEMQRMADQAQAVRSGAFGGSRQGIVEAERQRNLGMLQGDIRARGYQTAFDQAQQNFAREQQLREQSRQYGAGIGMQGLGLGLQGAGLLGQLGQSQFGQQKDIAGLQGQFGTQQQQLRQQALNQQYQDFLNQERYPYQQLEVMASLLRGTPMGTVQSMYTPPPSTIQNIGAFGLGAYGLRQLFGAKKGGQVREYARGGSVTDEGNIKRIVDDLSDTQLAQAKQAAMAREDVARLQAIAEEEAMRASERKGFAAMYNALPSGVQNRMAGGGIVAFNGEGSSLVEDEFGFVGTEGGLRVVPEDLGQESAGDPNRYGRALDLALDRIEAINAYKPTPHTQEELNRIIEQRFEREKKLAGNAPYSAFERYLAEAEGGRPQAMRQAKGLAALKAMGAILRPGGTMRGLAAAGEAFAGSYDTALQADRAEKRAIASMKFNLADAQRKERMGMIRSAQDAASQAVKDRQTAERAHVQKLGIQAQAAGRVAQAAKPTAQKAPSEAKLNERLGAAEVAYENDPSPANLKNVTALRRAVELTKTSEFGPDRLAVLMAGITGQQGIADLRAQIDAMRIDQQTRADINKRLTDATYSPEYMALKTPAERKAFIDNLERELVGKAGQPIVPRPGAGAASPRPGAGAAPAAAPAALPAGLNNDNASTLLTVGQIYQTARGPARWTGTGFTPVPAR